MFRGNDDTTSYDINKTENQISDLEVSLGDIDSKLDKIYQNKEDIKLLEKRQEVLEGQMKGLEYEEAIAMRNRELEDSRRQMQKLEQEIKALPMEEDVFKNRKESLAAQLKSSKLRLQNLEKIYKIAIERQKDIEKEEELAEKEKKEQELLDKKMEIIKDKQVKSGVISQPKGAATDDDSGELNKQ